MLTTEHGLHFVRRVDQGALAFGPDPDVLNAIGSKDAEPTSRKRNEDLLIGVTDAADAAVCHDANDGKLPAGDANLLVENPHRVVEPHQWQYLGAEHRDARASPVLRVREHPSDVHPKPTHLQEVRSRSGD